MSRRYVTAAAALCLLMAVLLAMPQLQGGGPLATTYVEALATEVHLGRRTAVYRVEVRSGSVLLAIFTGTVYRRTGHDSSLLPPAQRAG